MRGKIWKCSHTILSGLHLLSVGSACGAPGSTCDPHQGLCVLQGEACNIVLRGLQTREVQQLLADSRWTEACERMLGQVVEVGGEAGMLTRQRLRV